MDRDEQSKHYLRDYWREVPCQAWQHAWAFMYAHVWWALVTLFGGVIVNLLRIGLAYALRQAIPPLSFTRDLVLGAALTGLAMLLTWLWHLFVVTHARMHAVSLSKIKKLEDEKAAQEADVASHPNLSVTVEEVPTKDAALLHVVNSGGPIEKLYATPDFVSGDFVPLLHGTHYLENAYGVLCHKDLKVPVARLEGLGGGTFRWTFASRTHEEKKRTQVTFSSDTIPSTIHRSAVVKIEVTCEPENQGGKIEWQITFQGKGFRAEQIMPPP